MVNLATSDWVAIWIAVGSAVVTLFAWMFKPDPFKTWVKAQTASPVKRSVAGLLCLLAIVLVTFRVFVLFRQPDAWLANISGYYCIGTAGGPPCTAMQPAAWGSKSAGDGGNFCPDGFVNCRSFVWPPPFSGKNNGQSLHFTVELRGQPEGVIIAGCEPKYSSGESLPAELLRNNGAVDNTHEEWDIPPPPPGQNGYVVSLILGSRK